MKKNCTNCHPKKEELKCCAHDLFCKHGVKRVSVEEICQKAGVSKMTFYRHFTNKECMVEQIIKELFDDFHKQLLEIKRMKIPFEEKIQKILLKKIEFTEKYSREFLKEIMTGSIPELKEFIEEKNQNHLMDIRKMFVSAKKNGDIRKEVNIDFIMYMLIKMREMFHDEKLNHLYPDETCLMKEMFTFFYYGILTRKK